MVNFDRRAFLSILPSVSLAGSGKLQKLGGASALSNSFRNIPSQFIHPDTCTLHTLGYSTPGDRGHASYVSDQLATPDLAKLAPNFCTVSADGRRWRAAANTDDLVPVAAGGAVGSISVKQLGLGNQQPIIAQALLYQQAIGASGIVFNDGNYNIWCPHRSGIDDNINLDKSGIPFLIQGPTIFQSGPNGTTFTRRKYDGSDPSVFKGTQYLSYNSARNGTGIYWRGGMFMLVGSPNPRPKYSSLSTLHLKGTWNIYGGIPKSKTPGLVYIGNYYGLNPDGSGWDITDKPIWAENDRNTGDIIFEGNITIGGFRGELVYQGGITHGSIYQTGQLTVHDTDGDGFNPAPSFSNGTASGYGTLQIESLSVLNAFQALEGGSGWNGNIDNLLIQDCTQGGGIMSGVWGPGAQPANRPAPVLNIGSLSVLRCNWYAALRGNVINSVEVTDMSFWIGLSGLYTYNVSINSVKIYADKSNVSDGVIFFSAGANESGSYSYNNKIGTITLAQTQAGKTSNYCVIDPVDSFGMFGQGNVVNQLIGIAWQAPFNRNPSAISGVPPHINSIKLVYLKH